VTTQTAKLTTKQIRLLLAIARFWEEQGYSPSYPDLVMLADISSQSIVASNLRALSRQRLLTYAFRTARSIVLTEDGKALAKELAPA